MKVLHINSYYGKSLFYRHLFDRQSAYLEALKVYVPASSDFSPEAFDYGDYTLISKNHGVYDRYFFHLKHHKILKDLNRKLNIADYSIIHAHSLFSNGWVAMKAAEPFDLPFIVAVRNTDINVFFAKMMHLRKLGIKILKKAKHVIFLSDAYREHLLKTYIPAHFRDELQEKSSVIPNGIDDFWFDNIGTARTLNPDRRLRLLQVGDLDENKNIEISLKALRLLREKHIDASLDAVGRIRVDAIGERVRENEHARYLGYLSKEALLSTMRDSDLFVLPSKRESFGLVYAEAMSQGLPVIYSKGQGFDRQFEEGTVGYHVDSMNETELASRIMDIMGGYERISRNCIEKVDAFSWDVISDSYRKIYASCCESKVSR